MLGVDTREPFFISTENFLKKYRSKHFEKDAKSGKHVFFNRDQSFLV